jgi:serine/threonine-protein kinase
MTSTTTPPAEPRAPAASDSLSVGDVVAERYRIDGVLGEGGMGIVYRAEHLHLHKAHALKVLLPGWSSMPEVVARFEREAVAAGNIQSPHVAAATDFGRLPNGSFFLVMEYVNGRTLRAVLDAGPLEPARALHVLRGIVLALRAAHGRGVVHRDLKPENVMLVERDGSPDFAKVLDFGIAKVDGFGADTPGGLAAPLTRVGAVMGTPDYMSPEQALGQPVDERSDLYSAGVILFEMLAGRPPFEGGPVTVLQQHVTAEVPELPLAVTAGLDPRIAAVVRRLLAKAPENRFVDATELLGAIDGCATALGVPAIARPLAKATRPSSPWLHRIVARAAPLLRNASPRRIFVAAFLAATVVIGLVVVVVWPRATTPAAAPSATASSVMPVDSAELPAGTGESSPVTTLPPPPAPSATTAGSKPASSQTPSRKTGPGGIYVPPPSQWFR